MAPTPASLCTKYLHQKLARSPFPDPRWEILDFGTILGRGRAGLCTGRCFCFSLIFKLASRENSKRMKTDKKTFICKNKNLFLDVNNTCFCVWYIVVCFLDNYFSMMRMKQTTKKDKIKRARGTKQHTYRSSKAAPVNMTTCLPARNHCFTQTNHLFCKWRGKHFLGGRQACLQEQCTKMSIW